MKKQLQSLLCPPLAVSPLASRDLPVTWWPRKEEPGPVSLGVLLCVGSPPGVDSPELQELKEHLFI